MKYFYLFYQVFYLDVSLLYKNNIYNQNKARKVDITKPLTL